MTPSNGARIFGLAQHIVGMAQHGGVLADVALRRIQLGLGLRQLSLGLSQLRRLPYLGCLLGVVIRLGDQLGIVQRLVAVVIELGALVLGLRLTSGPRLPY